MSRRSTTRLTVRFDSAMIDTTVTRDATAADEWVRSVRASSLNSGGRGLIVGLDCEWKPNRSRWTTSKVAILQLCSGSRCLIFQLFCASYVPTSLRSFLADPSVRFVGVGVGEDVAKLEADYGLECASPVELKELCDGYMSVFGGGRRLGLQACAWEVLGMLMDKPHHVTMSNWEKRDLDTAQIQYACIDAYVSYRLGKKVLPK